MSQKQAENRHSAHGKQLLLEIILSNMTICMHDGNDCRTLLPAYPELLVVENALDDARFRNNPLVIGFPHIRFYCGK